MRMLLQEIANLIAAEQQMDTNEMKKLFGASEALVIEMESTMQAEFLTETGDAQVAAAVTAFLPIVVENAAITSYINSTGNYDLRIQTPEIISAKEAGLFAELEFSLDQGQINEVVQIIEHKWAALSGIHARTEDLISHQ